MGVVALKIKAMPESLETSLGDIKDKAVKSLMEKGAIKIDSEEQPIAFGLKALIFTIAWPEEKDTDIAENTLNSIEGISSGEKIDYRRAIG